MRRRPALARLIGNGMADAFGYSLSGALRLGALVFVLTFSFKLMGAI